MKQTCENCRYWKNNESYHSKGSGECRKNPPQVMFYKEDIKEETEEVGITKEIYLHKTIFPEIWEWDFCGEFKPKPKKK